MADSKAKVPLFTSYFNPIFRRLRHEAAQRASTN
jgi:hypothetical protein